MTGNSLVNRSMGAGVLAGCMLLLHPSCMDAQSGTDEGALVSLLREAARESAKRTEAASVALTVTPESANPMVLQIFSEELIASGKTVFIDPGKSRLRLIVQGRSMNSSTVPLANSSYLRTASIDFGVHAEDRTDGVVLWSQVFQLTSTDTLSGQAAYGSRNFLESPRSSWLDDWIPPVVAGAAAIIIVVLLFTVRGT